MLDFLMSHGGGYLGIILFLILTGCGLPIPEEVPIIAAGVFASQGLLDPWLAFAACIIGALAGDTVMFSLGYHFGHKALKNHPRFAKLLHSEREEKFEYLIQRHGLKVLFAARFMVGVRSPVYFAAGVLRIPYRRFLIYNAFAASVVVSLFFGLAFLFGEPIARVVRDVEKGLTVAAVIAVIGVAAIFFLRRYRRKSRLSEVRRLRAERSIDHDDVPPGEKHKRSVA